MEPASPEMQGRFLATGPPGKSGDTTGTKSLMVLGRQHVLRTPCICLSRSGGQNPCGPDASPPGRDTLPQGSPLSAPSPISPPPTLLLLVEIYQAPTMGWAPSREREHEEGRMQPRLQGAHSSFSPVCVCVWSLSHARLFATLWTVARQHSQLTLL